MKKILNNPKNFVNEMLEGTIKAHPEQLTYVNNDIRCIVKKNLNKKKVALASGGGSGHLPLFMGYVGEGMLDGCSVGGVFQSPSSEQMLNVTKAIDKDEGVLYIYGNYSGDILNFEMAMEMAEIEGIKVEQVICADDIASAPKGEENKRRGVAGIFFVYKIAGACADTGVSLKEVKEIAIKASNNVRTIGLALSPCIVPEVGKPLFALKDDEISLGMGIHGEPGISIEKIKPSDEIVNEMMEAILKDHEINKNDEASILINGLGATPKEELYIVSRGIHQILEKNKINVYNTYVGEFATSMEMAGFSISILKLDEELKEYLAKPANTPFFKQFELK